MADRFPEITSVEEFLRLRASEDPAEYDRSAWATMPLPVWWELATKRRCPPELLERLVDDLHDAVRRTIAGHPPHTHQGRWWHA